MAKIKPTPQQGQLSLALNFYGRIYLITNTVNGKVYIGQTTQSIKLRWRQHRYDALKREKTYPLQTAIRKHGAGSFTIEEIGTADSQDQLNRLEEHFVAVYRATERGVGYNVRTGGGSGGRLGPETIHKLRAALLGREPPNKGKKMPEHQRLEMMERFRVNGHPATGHVCSEHTKQRIAESNRLLKTGSIASDETKRRMSESHKQRFAVMTDAERLATQSHRKGVPRSESDRAKMSAGWATPERIARRERIVSMRLSGVKWAKIAAEFGVSRPTVIEIFNTYGPKK